MAVTVWPLACEIETVNDAVAPGPSPSSTDASEMEIVGTPSSLRIRPVPEESAIRALEGAVRFRRNVSSASLDVSP